MAFIDECLITTTHNMLEMVFSIVRVKSKFPGKLMRNNKHRLGFRPGFHYDLPNCARYTINK